MDTSKCWDSTWPQASASESQLLLLPLLCAHGEGLQSRGARGEVHTPVKDGVHGQVIFRNHISERQKKSVPFLETLYFHLQKLVKSF